MNLAEQMYEKACKNRSSLIPMKIYSIIENAVEQGYFYCQIDDLLLVQNSEKILIDLGFSVKFEADKSKGQIIKSYYTIGWEMKS